MRRKTKITSIEIEENRIEITIDHTQGAKYSYMRRKAKKKAKEILKNKRELIAKYGPQLYLNDHEYLGKIENLPEYPYQNKYFFSIEES